MTDSSRADALLGDGQRAARCWRRPRGGRGGVRGGGRASARAAAPRRTPGPDPGARPATGRSRASCSRASPAATRCTAEEHALAAWNGDDGRQRRRSPTSLHEKPAVIAGDDRDPGLQLGHDVHLRQVHAAVRRARCCCRSRTGYDLRHERLLARDPATYTRERRRPAGLPIHFGGYLMGLQQGPVRAGRRWTRSPPTTWDELFALAPKFNEKGIIPSVQPWLGDGRHLRCLLLQADVQLLRASHVQRRPDPGRVRRTRRACKTFQTIERGLKAGFWDPTYIQHHERARRVRRSSARATSASSSTGERLRARGRLAENYGRMANPGIDPGTTGTVNGSDGLGLSKFSVQQDAA